MNTEMGKMQLHGQEDMDVGKLDFCHGLFLLYLFCAESTNMIVLL